MYIEKVEKKLNRKLTKTEKEIAFAGYEAGREEILGVWGNALNAKNPPSPPGLSDSPKVDPYKQA